MTSMGPLGAAAAADDAVLEAATPPNSAGDDVGAVALAPTVGGTGSWDDGGCEANANAGESPAPPEGDLESAAAAAAPDSVCPTIPG